MVSRRDFILKAALGSAAVASAPLLSFSAEGNHKLKNIGYISGILKNNLAEGDWKEVLKRTVELGFTEYEGGLQGDSPEEFLKFCKSIGLKPVAGGVGISDDIDKIQPGLDTINAMQMEYAVCYWPWFVGGPFTLEDCKRSTETLNIMGERAKANGLKFCWHNHNKEFIDMEEGRPFDYLMAHTEKDLVAVEMDIYWVVKGEADPLEVLKKYEGRIPILHVKDMAPGSEMDFACPGSGIIDFPSIFAEAHRQGIRHYFVERDQCADGLACLESSGVYLKNLRF
ncbi:MAG: sugar phosphate isomerase/epimerase [Bacteroidota bacterium]